jgi:hypothetical protein
MARIRQSFTNRQDRPVYVSVEPWPHCFELEPGDKLTLIWDAAEAGEAGEAMQVEFLNETELILWPDDRLNDLEILFNDAPGEDRSWKFRHR